MVFSKPVRDTGFLFFRGFSHPELRLQVGYAVRTLFYAIGLNEKLRTRQLLPALLSIACSRRDLPPPSVGSSIACSRRDLPPPSVGASIACSRRDLPPPSIGSYLLHERQGWRECRDCTTAWMQEVEQRKERLSRSKSLPMQSSVPYRKSGNYTSMALIGGDCSTLSARSTVK
jgi:hypothetical protein